MKHDRLAAHARCRAPPRFAVGARFGISKTAETLATPDIVIVQGPAGGQEPSRLRTTDPGSGNAMTVTTVPGAYGNAHAAFGAP